MDRLKEDCEDTDWDSGVTVGDLNAYYYATCARYPQLVSLLVARGRLLVDDRLVNLLPYSGDDFGSG